MTQPVYSSSRAEKFLKAAACAYDRSPDTPAKLEVRAAVEALLRAAHAQPQATREQIEQIEQIEQLAVAAVCDPWSSSSARLAAEMLDPIPAGEWLAALVSAGIAEAADPVDLHPLFIQAGEAISRIHDEQGPDAVNAPENVHWLEQLLQYEPDQQQGISDYFRAERAACRVLH